MADEYIRKADAIKQCGFGMTSLHIANNLRKMRPADVAPVVHGKWIREWWHSGGVRKCSTCNITQTVNVYNGEVKFNYCPYCGAKMDEKGEE